MVRQSIRWLLDVLETLVGFEGETKCGVTTSSSVGDCSVRGVEERTGGTRRQQKRSRKRSRWKETSRRDTRSEIRSSRDGLKKGRKERKEKKGSWVQKRMTVDGQEELGRVFDDGRHIVAQVKYRYK